MNQSQAQKFIGSLGGTRYLRHIIKAYGFTYSPDVGLTFSFKGSERANLVTINNSNKSGGINVDFFNVSESTGEQECVKKLDSITFADFGVAFKNATGLELPVKSPNFSAVN